MKYHQLTLEERIEAYALASKGLSLRRIASILNRSHTTLSREWKRNNHQTYGYRPTWAHNTACERSTIQHCKARLKNQQVFRYVREKLSLHWSPEQIAGRLPIDYPGQSIHHETIYRYIYHDLQARWDKLWQYLRFHRYRRLKQANGRKVKAEKIDAIVRITDRPISALFREKTGHWETDNMIGRVSDKSVISAIVERKTRFTLLRLLSDKTAQTKAKSVVESLDNYPFRLRRTVTVDNGAENRNHRFVTEEIGTPVYFCNPYHSWEKGTVENTIGRVRQFLPKRKSLDEVSSEAVKAIEEQLNSTPRKCLGFKTPLEAITEDLTGIPFQKPINVAAPVQVQVQGICQESCVNGLAS